MVGISVLSTTLVYGMRHSFSVFFPYILEEFGWARGSTAIMLSLSILIYGFMAPLAGILCDRWKPKIVIVTGVLVLGLAVTSCAFAQELWHFYLLFGILVPIGIAFSGWPVFGPALANWFTFRRGLILGLGQMGLGLSFAYSMFVEFTISRVGWRGAYFVLSAILVGLLLPPVLFLFRYRPEDRITSVPSAEQLPAVHTQAKVDSAIPSSGHNGSSLRDATKTYQLWCLIACFFLFWGIGHYMVLAHQIKFAQDMGYSTMFAASVFAIVGAFLFIGYISGSISDWIGREVPITAASIFSIIALIALLSIKDTSQSWLLYVYAVFFGYAGGLFSSTIFAGTADLFHGKQYGAISNLLLTGMGLGGALGPWLGGHIYDTSGSYDSAFLFCMACYAIASVAFWAAAPRHAARFRMRKSLNQRIHDKQVYKLGDTSKR